MIQRGRRRITATVGAMLAVLACAPAAHATINGIPEQDGDTNGATTDIVCTDPGGADAGERHCSGIFTTFDGAPIDINVAFPPAPASGPDGNFPIVGVFHGWGGAKIAPQGEWVDNGYAFFSMSDRGWGLSCGATDPKRLMPMVCDEGYNHLMDTRFEVRDAQEVFEALADRDATGATAAGEGLIDPQKIGVTGGSYGGGISMALAALKNREMNNDSNVEGILVPWVSEGGKAMKIAAAQPDIPWTDLAYSLMPNGHTLDYVEDAPYLARDRIGVMKQSFVSGLYATGYTGSNYAGPGTGPMGTADPDADVNGWYALISGGEPYDSNPLGTDLVDEVTKHHSSYYIDASSTAPAPLLISNGWTDDLFPADEAIRFYNRTRSNHPGTPISLIFNDHGHQRGANKTEDAEFRDRQQHAWFDHYVKGTGPVPFAGVQTLTQTCGAPSDGASGPFDDPDTDLPFRAASWATLAPGEIVHTDVAAKNIAGPGGPDAATAYDPIGGGGACATAGGADVDGTASYRLAPAPADGFTLMGSPTVVADILSQGLNNQLAARLLDVDPMSGDAVLVARALYRPDINIGTSPTPQIFQLHPNGYHFAAGHIAKLELLAQDSPYGRTSNGQSPITVSALELRLPVVQAPGALAGLVTTPAAKVLPLGYELAADFLASGPGDQDGDGIPNAQDGCPTSPGPASNNGCPVLPGDTDRDGIPNSRDLCPTVIGIADNNGCPEQAGNSQRKAKKCKKRKAKKTAAAAKKKCKRKKR